MKTNRPRSEIFHAVTHVWGREYLDTFLNICIPNQLAPGNIPALPPGSRYRILTRSIHVDEINAHPMVQALRTVIPVDVIVIEALDQHKGIAHGQDLMIACHQRSIADIIEAKAAILWLSADFMFSENAMASIVRRHREGARAVVNTGLRLAREPFLARMRELNVPLDKVSSRELVRLALPYLHAHTESMFADARPFSLFPVAVYWRVADQGLLAKCLHLHPLMVDPMSDMLPRGSNDGRYLARVVPDPSLVHVITDSDELQMFEMTDQRRMVIAARGSGASAWRTAAVAAVCDHLQVGYWRTSTVRLHVGEFDERWDRVDAVAQRFAARVMQLLPHGRRIRRWLWFTGFVRDRADRYKREWRRRLPGLSSKQLFRPVRLATHRSVKTLRKTTRQLWRGAH